MTNIADGRQYTVKVGGKSEEICLDGAGKTHKKIATQRSGIEVTFLVNRLKHIFD